MNPGNITPQTRRLAHNVKWLSLQELLIRLLGLATAIYLARVLTPTAFGELGLAVAVIGILTTLVQAGTGSRGTRLTALDPASIPQTRASITGLRVTITFIVMAGLILCAPTLSQTFSFSANLLILCSFLLLRPALAVNWAFKGLDQMHVIAYSDVAEKSLMFIGLLLLVHGQGNDLLWVPVIETVAALAVVWWLRRRLAGMYSPPTISFNYREWAEISRESLPLGLAALLGSVYIHGALLLLGWLSTPASAADFLVAQKLMLTMIILLHVINNSAFPSASRLLVLDSAIALNLVADLLRYYLVLIIPGILVLALFADQILNLLFGVEYSDSGPVLMLLLTALPFLAISDSLQLVLKAIPKPKAVLTARIVSTLVLLVIAVLFVPRYGALGGAAAVVAGEAAAMVLLFWLVKRTLGATPWNARCYAAILAGVITALVLVLTQSWPLLFRLPFAAIVYILSAGLMKAVSVHEFRSVPHLISAALKNDKPE